MHVFLPAQRDAPTNMHNNAICVNSMHKLRFAQDLALYNLALDDASRFRRNGAPRGLDGGPGLEATRENVERITGIRDWAERCSWPTASTSHWSESCCGAVSSCRWRVHGD